MTTENHSKSPLSELAFLTLACLVRTGPDGNHGHGILKDIEEVTLGQRRYALPSLYEALGKLLARGLIELAHEPENHRTGKPIKVYRITGIGETVLRGHIANGQELFERVYAWLPRPSSS